MSDLPGHGTDAAQRRFVDLRLEQLFGSPGGRASRAVANELAGSGDPDADVTLVDDDVDFDQPGFDRPNFARADPARGQARHEADAAGDTAFADAIDSAGRRVWSGAARVVRWRIDPERRGALAVMGAILVAALAVGWQALAGRPHSQPVAAPVSVSTSGLTRAEVSGSAGARGSPAPGGSLASNGTAAGTAPTGGAVTVVKVVVDVVGRVHHPGLVTLPVGARVADAVRAAGGAWAGTDLSTINLARVCVDGEQIAVGVPGATAAAGAGTASGTGAGGTGSAGTGTGGAPVDLNTATADQLDALPGVGPVMAQRIIQYRTDHGPFTSVGQLQQVSGIGTAKFAELSPLVTV